MRKLTIALAAALLVPPAALSGQVPTGSWRLVPQLSLAFHGGYYDDLVVTTFADGDVDTDVLMIDPGAALRLGLAAEYAVAPGIWLSGGLAASWPDADLRIDGIPSADLDLGIYEFSAGALFRLGEWGSGAGVIPFYVGGDLNLVSHSFNNLFWEGQPTDISTMSLGLSGRFGAEYAIGPKLTLRGEGRLLFVRGGFGGLEDELAAAAARDEGVAAQTNLQRNTYSMFLLNAGLVFRL